MSLLPSQNIDFGTPIRPLAWRKAAVGTWRNLGDPSVYGVLELPAEKALAYIEKRRNHPGQKLTMTHFVGKAIAEVIHRHPEINAILRFGKIYPRKTVDVFFLVAADKVGKDLTGAIVRNARNKSLEEVADELNTSAAMIRQTKDVEFYKMKGLLNLLPDFLSGTVLWLIERLLYTFNIHIPALGIPKDAFGSVMVTSIGSLGLDFAFAPLVPFSGVPMMIAPGLVQSRCVFIEGQPREELYLRLCATFDHRLIDGVHASHMARTLRKIFNDPETELAHV